MRYHGQNSMFFQANLYRIAYLTCFFFLICACASKSAHVEKMVVQEKAVVEEASARSSLHSMVVSNIKGAPDWVNKGSNFTIVKDTRVIWGVSFASPQGDLALQKALADDNARDEVAREFSYYLEILAKDFASTSRLSGTVVHEESILLAFKSPAKETLAIVRIIGSWRDQKTSTVWSIAELDINQIKNKIAGMDDVNSDIKLYAESMADTIFDRIARDRSRELASSE